MNLISKNVAEIAPEDRIPLPQKIAFSVGANMEFVATSLAVNVFWMPYFNIGLGINPVVLGFILVILRGWDAIADLVMGNISDNARTRWGRRRPFMVVGAVLTAAMFPWLWRPPVGWSESATTIYLAVVGMVFFTCFSVWAMPYYGLQMELTPNYDERTRLTAWMTLFGKLSALMGGWAMAIVSSSWFANPVTGKPDIVNGVLSCSWVLAGLILIVGLFPPLFVRERYYESETRHQPRDPFWQSVRESFKNGPLWQLIGVSAFLVLGSSSVGSLGQYVNIYYVSGGDIAAASIITGWKSTIIVTVGVLCIPFWTWLGEKFDKKTVVATMLLGTMFGHLLNLICLRPDMPYLQLIPAIFESSAISAVWLFIPSMKGDIADYDELGTKRRREGALNAFFSWFFKVSMTCAMGLSGVLLQFSGFNIKVGAQPPLVLHSMVVSYIFVPLLIWSLALIFIWLYPLSRQKMAEIRSELETRRGKI
jgi:glycoside/pentoside/hexuronide:cation symporter, GPH family